MEFNLLNHKTNLWCLFLSRNYVIMVTMFFTVSVINNYALNFNIAMPLHMIFRSVSIVAYNSRPSCCIIAILHSRVCFDTLSYTLCSRCVCLTSCLVSSQGSLIANMILGIIILKKRYDSRARLDEVMSEQHRTPPVLCHFSLSFKRDEVRFFHPDSLHILNL